MRQTSLGNSGEKVSVIGLGFWQAGSPLWGTKGLMSPQDVKILLRTAVEEGISLIDTAEVYGWGESERLLGRALEAEPSLREDLFIATKVGGFRWRPEDIVKAARRSLERLGIGEIDLLQHHWPPPAYASLCKVAKGLEEVVENGLARFVGVSNYNTKLLSRLLECFHKHEPVSNQIQYSLAYRTPESRLIPLHEEKGIATIAWSPLAKGGLSAEQPRDLARSATKAQRSDPVFRRAINDVRLHAALEDISRQLGATKSQVALAWLVQKGAVPIPGTRRPERVKEYAAAGRLNLSSGMLEKLDQASQAYRKEGDYSALNHMRLIPGVLQALVIRLMGGV